LQRLKSSGIENANTDFTKNFSNALVTHDAEDLQKHMDNKLPKFVDIANMITNDTNCALVNVAKFERKWGHPFERSLTEEYTQKGRIRHARWQDKVSPQYADEKEKTRSEKEKAQYKNTADADDDEDEDANGLVKSVLDGLSDKELKEDHKLIRFDSEYYYDSNKVLKNTFTTASGDVWVNMMYQEYVKETIRFEEKRPYGDGELANVVILPFEGGDFQAMIVHPKRALFDQVFFDAFLSLNPASIDKKNILKLSLPRASGISNDSDLSDVLKNNFIPAAFAPGAIGKLVGSDNLVLNKISHKIAVTMDEEGARVEMATVGEEIAMCSPEEISIEINSPFMWVLQTKDGVNLAVTIVNSPPKADPVGLVALEGILNNKKSDADKLQALKKQKVKVLNEVGGCPDQKEFYDEFTKFAEDKYDKVRLQEFVKKWKDRTQESSEDSK